MASVPTGKKSRVRSFVEIWGAPIAAILGSAAFFAMIFPSSVPYSRTHDFLGFYTGGYLVRTAPALLYDIAAQSKVQYQFAPDIPIVTPFPRPAFSALFYYPIALLPLKTAFTVWVTLGIATLFSIWAWAARKFGPESLVYCAFFIPLLFGISTGQDTLFVTGLLILAYCALERGQHALGGVLLALLLCKFNLTLLVPVVLVIRKEWRILAGYAPTALAAVIVSAALASPASYLALLTNSKLEALHASPQMMVNTNSIALNTGLDFPVVRILLIAVVLAAVFSIPRTANLERWLFAAIGGSLLISPHTFEYDVALLLVPILKILADSAAPSLLRGVAATAAIPLPYFLTILPRPYSGTPALLIFVLFLAIAWPGWFKWRPWVFAFRPGRA
jgi:alpha-1,2-mannosyltransferase